jgi:glycosyltransferase involved in cell wall biosynthesis
LPAIREVTDLPVWYEAQDVEATLKRHVLGANPAARRLAARAEAIERACCEQAELIWACSAEDRAELAERYGVELDRVLIVPNGVALEEVSYAGPVVRAQRKSRMRLSDRFLAVFVASWHEPNVVAAREVVQLARIVPEVDFMIIGSVGLALGGLILPGNLAVTGVVELEFKQTVLGLADVALNPVRTGSGTNLKMLEYFGSGIPVISTAFGARGLGVVAGEHFIAAERGAFPFALRRLRAQNPTELESMVQATRLHAERHLAWPVITGALLAELRTLDGRLAPSPGVSESAAPAR